MGWYVIIGTIPICILGLFFKDEIRSEVRNLWVVATAMVVFSGVIALAEYLGRQSRHIEQLNWRDALVVGAAQCLALIPGVSRSGSTISAGLFLGLDRELSARFGFLLAIPAVFASGLFSTARRFHPVTEGMSATGAQLLVATLIAFVIGLAAVAWLLRFLVRHSHVLVRRVSAGAGAAVLVLLATGRSRRHDRHPVAPRPVHVEHRAHAGRPFRGRRPRRQGPRAGRRAGRSDR